MKKCTQLFFFLIISISSFCAQNQVADSLATITIKAKIYKNKTILFNFPSKYRPSIVLDSNGCGTITLIIKKTLFVSLQCNDSIFSNLLLEPRNNIIYNINNRITKIEGVGSYQNNYLIESRVLLNSITSSIKDNKNPYDFVNLMRYSEIKIDDFHKKFLDSIPLPPNISYILKNSILTSLLLEKQKYLLSLERSQIDSLNLENKLGLINNIIFSDTLLFNSHYLNFLNFLIYNFEQTVSNKLYLKHPETNIFPILLFNELNKCDKYSDKIKEFLLYSSLATELAENGINPTLENLCEVFYKIYPKSNYSVFLKKYFNTLGNLTKGNKALDFQAKMLNGQSTSLSNFKGKLTLIDVWATWCAPCKEELPYTSKIQKKFRNRNFSVIYLSIDKDESKWKIFLNKNKWMIDTGTNVITTNKDFKEFYKITSIPRYILIDENGLIIDAFCENPSKGNLENKINKILNDNGF
jgi:thiol-disulfide isomerase/thioredoxin